jgi:phosphate transport system permease protein
MEATPTTALAPSGLKRRGARPGDLLLYGLTAAAALATLVLLGLIAYKILDQAWLAIREIGVIDFIRGRDWDPNKEIFGAAAFIFGTALTSFFALLIAGPLAIAIALFLTELAPRFLGAPVGILVEMLAAIPSVVIGLWGILVLGPFLQEHVDPWLQSTLGFLPFFKGNPSPVGFLPAILVLTIMILPIVSSISRELFQAVPRDLKEGALALGMTRWEMVRGVVIPYTKAGIAAAMILGLGRAFGEAIAVTQVIGNTVTISWSLFDTGDTLASRIAAQYIGATTRLQISAIAFLAVILLALSLISNLVAQWIVRHFTRRQGLPVR